MAVYTNVSAEDLDVFLTHYDVGSALSFKGIAEGVENSNFLLKTTRGSYILTLYEKRVSEGDLPFFLALMEHLAEHHVTCPIPIKGRDGALHRTLNGRAAALISFLDGVSVQHPTIDHCRALGGALAELHVGAAGFEGQRKNGLGQKDWRGLFKKSKARADEVSRGLGSIIETELTKLDTIWPSYLPTGIIHGDLFPDNVFFIGNRLSGFIDFYFACNDMLAYDLAVCLNAWCFDDDQRFHPDQARAMISAYSQVRPFSELELDALPLLCRGAALRFLLTRLYDWLHHPDGALVAPKNPLDFLKRLQFHQSVRGPADYGLSA